MIYFMFVILFYIFNFYNDAIYHDHNMNAFETSCDFLPTFSLQIKFLI